MSLSNKEPDSVNQEDQPSVYELVCKDLAERVSYGKEKHGKLLKPHNGRRPLIDAYQEAMDLLFYLRQEIYERYGE